LRRTSKIAAVAVVATIALTGCGKKSDSTTATSTGTDDVCKTATGTSGPKVGLAYDVGGRGDQSFNDSAYAGVSKAVTQFDWKLPRGEARTASRSRPAGSPRPRWPRTARPPSSASGSPTATRSTRSPRVPEGELRGGRRFRPRQDAQQERGLLQLRRQRVLLPRGCGRCLTTKSNQVGFVGGVHNDLIKAFEAGYTTARTRSTRRSRSTSPTSRRPTSPASTTGRRQGRCGR
jgi:basic membrane protein A